MGWQDRFRKNNQMPKLSFREDSETGMIFVDLLNSNLDFSFSDPETDARWYMPGKTVTIHNITLSGGFFYVGTSLMSFDSYRGEPSLINPNLKIAQKTSSKPLPYWRSYADLTPAERTTYLTWLATGRRDPSIDIHFVFLYFFGLERRVLDDPDEEADIDAELPDIHAEVARLLNLYGPGSTSFDGYASTFLSILDLMLPPPKVFTPASPPPLIAETWDVPLSLPITIGQLAAHKMPVPPSWALAWAWYHPATRPRTPALRCKEEFARLFAIRYASVYGEGLKIRQGKARMRITYDPANFSMMYAPIRFETIPNAYEQKGPVRKLRDLFNHVTDDLDAYSRWIGRNPERGGTLAASAQLPPELVDSSHSASKAFIQWANAHLATAGPVQIPGAEVVALWLANDAEKLTKVQSTSFLDLAQQLGFGFEPDVRFGGPAITARDPVVLFRMSPDAPSTADPAYALATTIAHLAAAVAAVDGGLSDPDAKHLGNAVASTLHLPPTAQTRLLAYLLRLAATNIKLTGLKQRIQPLDTTRRGAIGDILIALASSDGIVSPAEVGMLIKVFRLLGLDPDSVTHRLHATLAPGGTAPAGASRTAANGFSLDPATIARIQAETTTVSSLLSDIFVDDETPPPTAPPATQEEPDDNDIAYQGLDLSHAQLLTALGTRSQWTRAEFEQLAKDVHVMPGGAIDVINDVAFDIIGDPVIEGDDTLTINIDLIEELKI